MSTNLRPFATISLIAASCFWACEPDLGALSSQYDPNASGAGGTKSDTGGTGGASGTNPTGGTGGTKAAGGASGTGGDSSIGGAGEEAGMAGVPAEGGSGATGGAGGTGGTSGSGGTGGTTTTTPCTNNKRDANESDVDCGGTSKCGPCDNNLRCTLDTDCQSTFCSKGHCTDPTCGDDVKNQGETGTDCGGPCPPCENDVACNTNDDCIGQYCKDMICTDHCTSGVKEADETDRDCGGKDCVACDPGKRCLTEKDCTSLICSNNKCVAPTCSDMVLNQGEGDVDCGAVCADQGKWCAAGTHKSCNLAADCDTSVCTNNVCVQDPVAATIQTIDIIDDFEAASSGMLLPTTGGRQGNWYGYDDMTTGSTHTTSEQLIPGHRGASSTRSMHTSGSGFTNWGAGVGADLNHGSTKTSYNASFDNGGTPAPYVGVTFWARSDLAPQSVAVVFPDSDTDPSGGLCTTCDHHYLTSISVGSDWQRFTVLFSNLMLEPGTVPTPTAFDPTRLVSVQFRVNPGAPFDYWIDDVAFVRPQQ